MKSLRAARKLKSTKAFCMCVRQQARSKVCWLVLAVPLFFLVNSGWGLQSSGEVSLQPASHRLAALGLAAAAGAGGAEEPPLTIPWAPYSERPSTSEQVGASASGEPEAKQASNPQTAAPAPETASGVAPVWIFCAEQWAECWCRGNIRWGSGQRWHEIRLPPGQAEHRVKCSIEKLPDIAPGDGGKHCQCAVTPGSNFHKSLNPALLHSYPGPLQSQGTGGGTLATSCEILEAGAGEGDWGAKLWEACEAFCSPTWGRRNGIVNGSRGMPQETMQDLMRSWVDPRFLENYRKFFDKSGWAAKGFVNYYAGPPSGRHTIMTEELVKSVHLFSSQPIIVVHFGFATPGTWTPQLFPQLVLLHAAPIPVASHRSFNFNKFRAMLMARVRIGVQLDSDQFVAPGVDAIFPRTADEVTKDYPFPILPVHFLDRTPKDLGAYWARYCPNNVCKYQTARWGHAHPTWTYWALPFLGRWLRRNFRDETLPAREGGSMSPLRITNIPEDEDLLNVGTWEEGGTKQWCKLDLPGPGDFEALLNSDTRDCLHGSCGNIAGDSRFHKVGAAKAFYTAHHAIDPAETRRYVERLRKKQTAGIPPPIMFNRKFYATGEELKAANPAMACII